ncbi:hypothetical protein HYFRA_00011262 [Hymenoscyphus fraxineus]|uniref:Dipeptidyl-peptidase V n=1 Tax=Hymenoscyphus fraxineus TaxID=746836 RepID=A0A9N9PTJ8_9HELO|nr:hypothetical protein HYFRA_00011262 [Hymenoscyphus fraxineus]
MALLLSLSILLSTILAAGNFTPEIMLSLKRRQYAAPNPEGTFALYTSTQWDFKANANSYELSVYNLTNGTTEKDRTLLFSNSSSVSNALWLGDGTMFVWFVWEDDGSTTVKVGDAIKPEAESITAGKLPGFADGLKLVELSKGNYAVTFYGTADSDGKLVNFSAQQTPASSARMYTQTFVRHWDSYVAPQKNSIWYTTLSSDSSGYTLGQPINALSGTGLESPLPPFPDPSQYDIGKNGIVFTAKDPKLPQATTTKSDIYYIPLKTFQESPPTPQVILTSGLEGASSGPVFSPDGVSLVFLSMKEYAYEADKNRIMFVADITKSATSEEFYATPDGNGGWDRSPISVTWSVDGKSLYLPADDFGRSRLFSVAADPKVKELPQIIFAEGWVDRASPVIDGRILVSSESLLDNSIYSWVDPVISGSKNATEGVTLIDANLKYGAEWGLSSSQISEFWYKGEGDYQVHSWVVRPSFYKEGEKYPLFFYVHGGPQSANTDWWSYRWNLALWAEQGYIVVAPNPTGSTGFGQSFTDDVQNEWGGRPYKDLELAFTHIEKSMPEIDVANAVQVGSSYGGYMTYWISGQPLGKKFKAQLVQDGIFNTVQFYATDELWYIQHEFNGTLWDNYDNYDRWNPARFTKEWTTPMLIVHSDLDYRVPVADGLAAFNVLQSKGVPSIFLNYPDEGHNIVNAENSLIFHKTMFDFLNGYVGLPRYSDEGDQAYRATLQNGPWILNGN